MQKEFIISFVLLVFLWGCKKEEEAMIPEESTSTGYSCSNLDGCYEEEDGQYETIEDCETNCAFFRYACTESGCVEEFTTGPVMEAFVSLQDCETNCSHFLSEDKIIGSWQDTFQGGIEITNATTFNQVTYLDFITENQNYQLYMPPQPNSFAMQMVGGFVVQESGQLLSDAINTGSPNPMDYLCDELLTISQDGAWSYLKMSVDFICQDDYTIGNVWDQSSDSQMVLEQNGTWSIQGDTALVLNTGQESLIFKAQITGDDLIIKYSLTDENNNEQATFWEKQY